MRNVKAVFKKQAKDTVKNAATLVQFLLFPAVAFAMTELVARGEMFAESDLPETMFITMMAATFVGMALIPFVASIVAEDREKKSLRFLIMAGVKPHDYLMGIGGVVLFASLFPSVAFGLMGRFAPGELGIFLAVLLSAATASILLGLTIGIYAKNVQAATGLAMPVAMMLGFGPTIAPFNEQIARALGVFYTLQLNLVMAGFYTVSGAQADPGIVLQSFAIIWANIAVLAVLFAVAFAKKGLRS